MREEVNGASFDQDETISEMRPEHLNNSLKEAEKLCRTERKWEVVLGFV